MKLLDQYLYAIGKKLPYKGRQEIEMELKSLLLDEIESKYGENPTEAQVEAIIEAYGSPREVANRYKNNNLVIGAGYTDLFFMIMKIIVFAMTVAFTVTFCVQLFSGEFNDSSIVLNILNIPANVITASISAFGTLTLVFILLTRLNKDQYIEVDEQWSVKELKNIQIGPAAESKVSSAFSVFFILLFIVIVNMAPELITLAEKSFETSGILLNHHVNIDVFKGYLVLLSAVWLGELLYHAVNLYQGPSLKLALYELLVEIAGVIVLVILFADRSLYMDYSGFLGFRGVFGVVMIISAIEAVGKVFKFIKHYVFKA